MPNFKELLELEPAVFLQTFLSLIRVVAARWRCRRPQPGSPVILLPKISRYVSKTVSVAKHSRLSGAPYTAFNFITEIQKQLIYFCVNKTQNSSVPLLNFLKFKLMRRWVVKPVERNSVVSMHPP